MYLEDTATFLLTDADGSMYSTAPDSVNKPLWCGYFTVSCRCRCCWTNQSCFCFCQYKLHLQQLQQPLFICCFFFMSLWTFYNTCFWAVGFSMFFGPANLIQGRTHSSLHFAKHIEKCYQVV